MTPYRQQAPIQKIPPHRCHKQSADILNSEWSGFTRVALHLLCHLQKSGKGRKLCF